MDTSTTSNLGVIPAAVLAMLVTHGQGCINNRARRGTEVPGPVLQSGLADWL